jgi:hypothetical protein
LSTDPKDYVKIAEQLSKTSDVNNMLDFILCMVSNGHLSNPNATSSDTNWRARRLMMKVITKTPVIPISLIVTGVTMPAERDYIGGGGYGHVYKGELGGRTVALKVLYKANNSVVGPSGRSYYVIVDLVQTGLLSRGIDVGISEAQVRAAVFRNL